MTCYTFGTERIYSHREQQRRLKNEQDDRKSKNLQITESYHCDKVILAGHYYNGAGKPSYYGAVYEFLTEDTGCEAEIGLREVSGVDFMDEGHALEWAMKNANN